MEVAVRKWLRRVLLFPGSQFGPLCAHVIPLRTVANNAATMFVVGMESERVHTSFTLRVRSGGVRMALCFFFHPSRP